MLPKSVYCHICGDYLKEVDCHKDAIWQFRHDDLEDCVIRLAKDVAKLEKKVEDMEKERG